MDDLSKEIKPYRCLDNLVHNRICAGERNPSGNGLLTTSIYYILRVIRSEFTEVDALEMLPVFTACRAFGIPGLFNRAPTHPDQEGPDDYVGLGACSSFTGFRGIAQDILTCGRDRPFALGFLKLYFNFCNLTPQIVLHRDSWLGRQGQLVAHFRFAAGETPSWWQKLWWAAAVATSAFAHKEDQDAWMLSWLLCVAAPKDPGFLCRWARRYWFKKMSATFPDHGIREPLQKSLMDDPNHPLVRYWPDKDPLAELTA
jgi:hypothetical protein